MTGFFFFFFAFWLLQMMFHPAVQEQLTIVLKSVRTDEDTWKKVSRKVYTAGLSLVLSLCQTIGNLCWCMTCLRGLLLCLNTSTFLY